MDSVVERYDTFHDWNWQLQRACEDERLEDVESIAGLRPPKQVALAHVTVTETNRDGFSTRKTDNDIELVQFAAMARARASLPPFPPWWHVPARRTLRHELLRTPPEIGGTSLFWAQSLECLQILLRRGARLDDLGWMGIPLVVHVAQLGNLQMLRWLIEERRQDADATRIDGLYTALHWASGRDVVEFLVEQGADPRARTAHSDSVLAQQVRSGDAETVTYLLSLGRARISTQNAFHWLKLDPPMLQALLRGGVPPDQAVGAAFGQHDETLLLHKLLWIGLDEAEQAASHDERHDAGERLVACARLALEHGFDPSRRDPHNQLAYHILADYGQALAEQHRARLEEILAPFDGPRMASPRPDDDCSCGLNLAASTRRRLAGP